MRVLHSVPYFYPAWAYGGIPRLSYHLCAELAKQGVEVDVVTTDAFDEKRRRKEREFTVDGINIRVYRNLSNYFAYHWQFFYPLGLKKEKSKISNHDLVHIHGHRNLLNTWINFWAGEKKIPVILQPNGTLVNIERRRALKKIYDFIWGARQIKFIDIFIAVSEAEKKQFIEMDISPEKIRVVPNGVFVEPVKPEYDFKAKIGIKTDYVLYLGKLTPRKGIEHLIKAISLLKRKDIIAVIAGNDMGVKTKLEKLADNLGVRDRVIFTGLLTSPWKESAFHQALLTVYAGEYEIFGLSAFESILCGTPVIVADDSGCGEWLKKTGGGWIVPYGDAKAIAKIVDEFSSENKPKMTLAAQKWIQENLSWKKIASEVKKIYTEILERR